MRDRESQRVDSGHRGWYILEVSLIIFGAAAFVLGAADIARIFHARAAVRQGVTDGLRCLYPSAESCAATIPGNATFTLPLFRSFVLAPGAFEYPRSQYTLTSDWFNEAILSARRVNRRLSSIDVVYGLSAYHPYDVKFPVDAHAMYLVQIRDMPKVELHPDTDLPPQQRVIRSRFRERATGAEFPGEPPGHKVLSLSRVRGRTSSSSKEMIGQVEFNIQDAWPTRDGDRAKISALRSTFGYQGKIPCYRAAWKQSANGPAIEWASSGRESCSYHSQASELFDGSSLLVPLMIRISGDRYDTSSEAKGIVSAELQYAREGAQHTYSLGGREFQGNSTNASFVIRGVGQGFDADDAYFSVCKDQARYEECEKYASLPLIPHDSQVILKFYLERSEGSGTVGWAGDWVQVFYPQFGLGQEKRACGRSKNPHVCGESVEPMRPLFAHTDINEGITGERLPVDRLGCYRRPPPGSYPSEQEALADLQAKFESGRLALAPKQFTAGSTGAGARCQESRRSIPSCNDAGVTTYRGCEKPLEYSRDQMLSKCGVTDFNPSQDRIENIRFRDSLLSGEERRAACSGEPFPECARGQLVEGGERFYTDDDRTSCRYARYKSGPVGEYGPLYDLKKEPGCVDIVEQLTGDYRRSFPQLPPQVTIEVATTQLPPERKATPPANRCQRYTSEPSREVECATGVAYYAAEQCCLDRGGACRVERIRVGGSAGSAAVWQGRVALARARAEETVRTAYPRVQSVGSAPCAADAKRCLQIQGTTVEDSTRVQLSASMQVPLGLLGWLGLRDMTTVQYSETRALETALMDNSG
jgi:hypothetical protein